MFDRPYYNKQPFQNNGYYADPYIHPQQWQYSQTPPTDPIVFQTPFEQYAKPKQPNDWYAHMHMNSTSYIPPNTNGLFSYFQDKNGQIDLDKMFSTVGQLANTVQQISPVVKQFGSIFK